MKTKYVKIALNSRGAYLGREKGCLVIRDRNGKIKKYPLFENEIGEIRLQTGSSVSTGVLTTCCYWGINILIETARGHLVGVLKTLEDDSHVKTRLAQYESFKTRKLEIAKKFVIGKIEGQNQILKKYDLRLHDNSLVEKINSLQEDDHSLARRKLTGYEGKSSEKYFAQIFRLIIEPIRPKKRKKFKAFNGVDNLFNLAYEILKWKVHTALIKAKLEPYLGFLHSVQFGKPSLVCDFQEIYRYLIDNFVINYCQGLEKKDFLLKSEIYSHSSNKKGEREYLNDMKTRKFMKELNLYFESKVKIPRIKVGKRQEIETLINEEAFLFAKYLRNERKTWNPRIVSFEALSKG